MKLALLTFCTLQVAEGFQFSPPGKFLSLRRPLVVHSRGKQPAFGSDFTDGMESAREESRLLPFEKSLRNAFPASIVLTKVWLSWSMIGLLWCWVHDLATPVGIASMHLVLRGLALSYLIAFWSVLPQMQGLFGPHGKS